MNIDFSKFECRVVKDQKTNTIIAVALADLKGFDSVLFKVPVVELVVYVIQNSLNFEVGKEPSDTTEVDADVFLKKNLPAVLQMYIKDKTK